MYYTPFVSAHGFKGYAPLILENSCGSPSGKSPQRLLSFLPVALYIHENPCIISLVVVSELFVCRKIDKILELIKCIAVMSYEYSRLASRNIYAFSGIRIVADRYLCLYSHIGKQRSDKFDAYVYRLDFKNNLYLCRSLSESEKALLRLCYNLVRHLVRRRSELLCPSFNCCFNRLSDSCIFFSHFM